MGLFKKFLESMWLLKMKEEATSDLVGEPFLRDCLIIIISGVICTLLRYLPPYLVYHKAQVSYSNMWPPTISMNKSLKMNIKKTDDMSEETVQSFFNLIYRMAENMGFEVSIPNETRIVLSEIDDRE